MIKGHIVLITTLSCVISWNGKTMGMVKNGMGNNVKDCNENL